MLLSEEGDSQQEIVNRISQGKRVAQLLNPVQWFKMIGEEINGRIRAVELKSVVTYIAETW